MDANAITDAIVSAAAQVAGDTWQKIRQSAPIYVRGFAQALVDIAAGVLRGEISRTDGKMYAQNARLMLVQGIANTAQILLVQVQKLMDSVFNTVRTGINGALKVAIL